MARKLEVELVADATKLEAGFKRAERASKNFNREVSRGRTASQFARGGIAGGGFGGGAMLFGSGQFVAAAAITAVATKSIQAASNLNEEINKSKVIFGASSDAILSWSKTTADAFGISQRAALGAAGGFGQMLETSGMSEKAAADMSRRLVELAGDMASFNNISTDEALEKLRSGLAGEAEPLRVLGVQLSENRVKQEAYRTGIAKVGSTLTEAQKVQARYNIIFKDTARQQGDAARTGNQLAGRQRVLKARTEELAARLGEDLVPVLTDLIGLFLDAEDAARRFFHALPGGTKFKLLDLFPKSGVSTDFVADLKRQSDQLDAIGRGGAMGEGFQKAGITAEKIRKRAKVSAEMRNRWFDAMIGRKIDRVQDIQSLQGQLAALRAISALITARLAITKDVTRKLTLEDRLVELRRQRRGILEEIRDRAKQAAEERKALEEEARQRRIAARNARQFLALGLTAEGDERAPGIAALSRQLARVNKQISGPLARKFHSTLRGLARVLSGDLGVVGREVRLKVKEILDGIDDEIEKHQKQQTKFRHLNAKAFIDRLGINLPPQARRRLFAQLATIGLGGTAPAARSGAFAGAGAFHGSTINVYGVTDLKGIETQAHKRARGRAKTRRGA